MSDTPRTRAVLIENHPGDYRDIPKAIDAYNAMQAHARDLERELIAANEEIAYQKGSLAAAVLSDQVQEISKWRARAETAEAQLAALKASLGPVTRFGLAVLEESRESLADLDGGWLQDTAVQMGLIKPITVTESCGEECRCVEYGFPTECYRYTAEVDALRLLEGACSK